MTHTVYSNYSTTRGVITNTYTFMYVQYHFALYLNTFTYAQGKSHKGGLTFREGNKDCFVMNKNVHSLWFVNISLFSKLS